MFYGSVLGTFIIFFYKLYRNMRLTHPTVDLIFFNRTAKDAFAQRLVEKDTKEEVVNLWHTPHFDSIVFTPTN